MEISGLKESYENMVSYILENPYSPHLASEVEEVSIRMEKIKKIIRVLEINMTLFFVKEVEE